MTPRPSVNGLASTLPYVCRSCLRRQMLDKSAQRRSIAQNYLRKKAEAEQQWQAQAWEIRQGRKDSMLTTLEKRGYINSIAGERDALDKLMTNKRIGAYVGIDPTAPSMHVGHLLPFMTLFWLYINGYHAASLLGGATAKIGDPTGRVTSREDQHSSVRTANMASMHYQLKKLWANVETQARKYDYVWEWAWRRELTNNNAWFNKLPLLEVLKVLGPGVRIGTMLGRDTVRNKMEKGDGLSFAEFSYPVMQAWDWWYMYQTKGIQLQIGGSDQFGNIIAGIDAIKYIAKTHPDPLIRQEKEDPLMKPMGFTVPLLTSASGEKFGKSAGNAIWLDKEMTSPFDLHQFFFRTADADVGRYLRLFTFIPLHEIDMIMAEQTAAPSKRPAQRRLAREIIELIHGEEEAKAAEAQAEMLFRPSTTPKPESGKEPGEKTDSKPTNAEISTSLNRFASQTNANNAPSAHVTLPQSLVYDQPIARILYSAGLVSSRSEGNRLAINQGAYIGSRPGGGGGMSDQMDFVSVKHWFPHEIEQYIIDGNLLILRVGKWKIKVVKIVSDEEFEQSGGTAPGWDELKAEWKMEMEMEMEMEGEGAVKEEVEEEVAEEAEEKQQMSNRKKRETMARIRKRKENEWEGAGAGVGKKFKPPGYKLVKYDPFQKPANKEAVPLRYHFSENQD